MPRWRVPTRSMVGSHTTAWVRPARSDDRRKVAHRGVAALFVAREENREVARAIIGESGEHRGNRAFGVGGAESVHALVLHLGRERIARPPRSGGHRVDVHVHERARGAEHGEHVGVAVTRVDEGNLVGVEDAEARREMFGEPVFVSVGVSRVEPHEFTEEIDDAGHPSIVDALTGDGP